MKKLVIIFILLVSSTAGIGKTETIKLFHIAKSTNDNVVVYEANMDNGSLSSGDPLEIYWLEDDHSTAELSWLERKMAYGVKYSSQIAGERYEFHVIAVPQKKVTLVVDAGMPVAVTDISGSQAIIENVFVEMTGTGLTSNIKHIDITGVTLDTGEVITERMVK